MGIYLDAPDLTVPVLEYFERRRPELAYRLRLDKTGEIEWLGWETGQEVIYHNEPGASFWKRFSAGFYSLLPLESQL
jgi:putative cardiolipin synthase